MTLGVILGVVGCVLPFAVCRRTVDRATSGMELILWIWLTTIYWTALIVWLVMQ